jgi:hypothetical protein
MFSEEDMAVFSLVSELKGQGRTYTDIHLALRSGQRGAPPVMPPNEVQALMVGDQEKRLALEVDYLQRMLVRTQQELDDARSQIAALREAGYENIRLKEALEHGKERLTDQGKYSQERIQQLTEQLLQAQEQLRESLDQRARLEREVGQAYAKGIVEALERKGDLPQK